MDGWLDVLRHFKKSIHLKKNIDEAPTNEWSDGLRHVEKVIILKRKSG